MIWLKFTGDRSYGSMMLCEIDVQFTDYLVSLPVIYRGLGLCWGLRMRAYEFFR